MKRIILAIMLMLIASIALAENIVSWEITKLTEPQVEAVKGWTVYFVEQGKSNWQFKSVGHDNKIILDGILEPNKRYNLYVRASTMDGWGDKSNVIEVMIPEFDVPEDVVLYKKVTIPGVTIKLNITTNTGE